MLKRTFYFLLLTFCISSCTKQELSTKTELAETSVSSSASSNTTVSAPTAFGAAISNLDGPKELEVADKLGAKYLRRTLALDDVNVSGLQKISDAGLGVFLNVNYTSKKPDPFVTNIADYKAKLIKLLDSYKPTVIVVKNEELNTNYNSGKAEDYINEINAACEVAHARGVKVANGGIGSTMAIILTYHDYLARGLATEAADFARRMIPPEIVQQSFNRETMITKINFAKTLINGYKNTTLDYVNFHWYQPARINDENTDTNVDIKAVKEVVDYLSRATGKTVISNETGQRNSSPDVVSQTVTAFHDAGVPYMLWYSGDGKKDGAVALHNLTGTLRPNGEAYASTVKNYLFK